MSDFADLYHQTIDTGLCTRCGTCAGVCPTNVLEMDKNAYPYLAGKCVECGYCVSCCPGSDLNLPAMSRHLLNTDYDVFNTQGHVAQQFVGYPMDKTIRYAGASGGLVTGLLVYMLEKGIIDGALVVGMDPDRPYLSKGVLATTRKEIVQAAQSKYCITPSMEVLSKIRKKKGRFAVVALPCQVHALRKMKDTDPSLSKKIHCILGLYCHCTLNQNGHLEAIEACNIDLADIREFQFRGGGWPGGFYVILRDGRHRRLHPLNIQTAMNTMFRLYGAGRCYLCVDALAEFADLSFGDFWATDYKGYLGSLERCTLVSQRTDRGHIVLENALKDGAIWLHQLPLGLSSKRILNMAEGKKSRSLFRLSRRKAKGLSIPNYHFPLPNLPWRVRISAANYRAFSIFKPPKIRRFILRLMSTPLGNKLHYLNSWRKRWVNGIINTE